MEQNTKVLLQEFQRRLNVEPDAREFEPTPDGKARTLPISFVQMTLDELFLGLWESHSFTYSQIFNEVVGSIVLEVTHPITGCKIRRTGAASVIIMQDKDAQIAEFNMTKKKNALDLAFPKLRAECEKSAAQTLGKIFGRDINRKKVDTFKPALKQIQDDALSAAIKRIESGEHHIAALVKENFIMNEEQTALLEGALPATKRLN